jgi:hypothetical protein
MAPRSAASLRRALIAFAVLAGLWVLMLALTGGFRVTVAGIRILAQHHDSDSSHVTERLRRYRIVVPVWPELAHPGVRRPQV